MDILTKEKTTKRTHIFEKDELTLENIVRVCRYCLVSGKLFAVKISLEDWNSFYKTKITAHLKDKVTNEQYTFLNKNLTPLENEK